VAAYCSIDWFEAEEVVVFSFVGLGHDYTFRNVRIGRSI
jgi:hypothetical protein